MGEPCMLMQGWGLSHLQVALTMRHAPELCFLESKIA